MRASTGFMAGLVVGVAMGVIGMLVLADGDGPTQPVADRTPDTVERDAESDRPMRAGLDPAPGRPISAEPGPGVTPAAAADAPGASAAAPVLAPTAEEVFQAALAEVRQQLRELRGAEAGAPLVLKRYEAWRDQSLGTDEPLAELAGHALIRLADWGLLRPEEVDALAEAYARLEPGAPGRPGLAGAVARAWARDRRLLAWFDGLPSVAEPKVRATVVEALDESASDAYREYLLRLSRAERDPDVLEATWHEDPITVAMTREWAPRLVAAIEPRVMEGDLPPVVRGRALFAIGLAAVYEPSDASAAIGRLLDRESDAGVRAYGLAVLDAISREEANVQTLDGLWARHRQSFGQ